MARLPRLALDGQLHLVLQLGHNGQPVFIDEADRRSYLDALRDAARSETVALHAYALLDSEVWLLVTPAAGAGLSRCMQAVGRRYVGAFNRRHARSGTVWAGRFRTTVVEPGAHLLDCMVHVEGLPEQAGLAGSAGDWPWSSAAHHLGWRRDPLVTEHPGFWALGNTPFDREARYRERLGRGLTAGTSARLDEAVRKGWALGSPAFVDGLQSASDRRLVPKPRGRPRKPDRAGARSDQPVPKKDKERLVGS